MLIATKWVRLLAGFVLLPFPINVYAGEATTKYVEVRANVRPTVSITITSPSPQTSPKGDVSSTWNGNINPLTTQFPITIPIRGQVVSNATSANVTGSGIKLTVETSVPNPVLRLADGPTENGIRVNFTGRVGDSGVTQLDLQPMRPRIPSGVADIVIDGRIDSNGAIVNNVPGSFWDLPLGTYTGSLRITAFLD